MSSSSSHARSGFAPAIVSGRRMFSSAVSIGSRLKNWKTKPMWSRRSRVSFCVVESVDLGSGNRDRATGGLVQSREDVHQRGLARAGRSHHGDKLAVAHFDRHAAESVDGSRTLPVPPSYITRLNDVAVALRFNSLFGTCALCSHVCGYSSRLLSSRSDLNHSLTLREGPIAGRGSGPTGAGTRTLPRRTTATPGSGGLSIYSTPAPTAWQWARNPGPITDIGAVSLSGDARPCSCRARTPKPPPARSDATANRPDSRSGTPRPRGPAAIRPGERARG